VEIRGPVQVGHAAVLDRGNVGGTTRVFELIGLGADGITFRNLSLTGAYIGIYANTTSNSDNVTLDNLSVYGNNNNGVELQSSNDFVTVLGGEYFDNNGSGIYLRGTNATVTGTLFYNRATPIYTQNVGSNTTGANTLIENIEAFGMSQVGISISGTGSVVRNSVSHDNGTYGISAGAGVLVTGNVTYGQVGPFGGGLDAGLQGSGNYIGNISYGNSDGVYLTGGRAEGNTVYGNADRGIYIQNGDAVIIGNTIFDNRIGAVVGYRSEASNNLIYGNTDYGIYVSSSDTDVRNNTIYQSTGEAIWVAGSDVRLNSNILWVEGGPAIRVNDNSQVDFTSDYNVFHITGTGTLGLWEGFTFTNRADWFYELGLDEHSIVTDPQLVDPDGADNVLGLEKIRLDNSDAGFSTTGGWTEVFDASAENGSYFERDAGSNGTATWTYSGLANGRFMLYATWPKAGSVAIA
jgi:parallel beta-helix repeat protein